MLKAAVLVGLNQFKEVGYVLEGCVNDITDRYERMQRLYGFPADNTHVLLDERATRINIVNRLLQLSELANRTADPSQHLFYFSGHGTQFRCWSGLELDDSLNEALCPYDFDFVKGESTFILDKDLAQIFSYFPPRAELTVILDCCHSGTGTRGFTPHASGSLGNTVFSSERHLTTEEQRLLRRMDDTHVKFVAPPLDVQLRHHDRVGLKKRKIGGWLQASPNMNHLLVAACADNETAADSTFGIEEARPNGAFSWALMQSEDRGMARTWLQVVEDAREILKNEGFNQSPQLEGPAARINGYPFVKVG